MALLLCYLLAYVGLRMGGVLVLLAILTGLTLIGPILAIGLFSISCQLQNGLIPALGYCFRDSARGLGNLGLFTSVLTGILLSVITGLLGLVVVFPVRGHATWHAYRETVDAGDWPQYE
jgi:uncharacterized membrane protein